MSSHAITQVFQPNRIVSGRAMALLALTQGGLLLLLWSQSPVAVLPGPLEVIQAWGRLWTEQGLGPALFASAVTSAEAVALTALVSLGLGYLTVVPAMRPLVGLVSQGRFLGLMGLSFVFTLLVGGGHALKLVVLVFGMSVFTVTSLASTVANIPQAQFDHARTLRMSEWRVVWEVVVRGTLDQAIEAIRQNAAMGWTMLTLVEGLVRSEGGVGALLLNQNKHFHLAEVFAIQLSLLGVGLMQDWVIGSVRRGLCPWAELKAGRTS